eukprot:TRINITY_DN48353_c0_g1_i1.p1 TRINITY_DN48353_c0_g1~~TRINITY_DN48353_c0_g1_i1.p1  ORF type:complete len:566 (-),score=118.06 TRINITY_DN48353_c0_g1_i1:118-1815(-)
MAAASKAEASEKVPHALASLCRWVALAAGREQTETLLGSTGVEDHLRLLQVQKVPEAVAASLSSSLVTARNAVTGSDWDCIEAVAAAAKRAVMAVASAEPPEQTELEAPACSPDLLSMAKGLGLYWWHAAQRQQDDAQTALCLALQAFWRAYWGHPPWRGANLGGWLLLEPGPASPFFDTCHAKILEVRNETPVELNPGQENPPGLDDEFALCRALEAAGGAELRRQLFATHRARHFDELTFERLAESGLNAVRLPLGYWVVSGPGKGEPYEGPCLDVVDKAVDMATARGLQVLLDLHGNPGGESGDRPCGRKDASWSWQNWRQDEAVELLRQLAVRYCSHPCVTGVQVCNEPSPSIPTETLCTFYERAIEAIREGGMGVESVAVVLPVFTHWRLPDITKCWRERGNFLKYDNVVFDLHYYHNFSNIWNLLSQAQHLDVVAEHARELKHLAGAVVGEWSISRPGDWTDEEKAEFAARQVLAYNHASHGWFFWNWHDHDFYPDWDFERGVLAKGKLPLPLDNATLLGSLHPEWEEDCWSSLPGKPLPGLWPSLLSWASWIRSAFVS